MCKISIIIPYFNREDSILRALESIKNQTFKDYEIILIDDGSSDSSSQIIDEFAKRNSELKRANLHQQNSGPSIARNNGISVAKGKYIAFLDSDDEWLPEKLNIQMELMVKKEMDMLGCNYFLITNNCKKEYSFINVFIKQISFKKLLFKHYYATPCVLVKKDVLMDVGLFPEGQRYMEDAYIFTTIARKYKAYMCCDYLVNIYKMPFGEEGLSAEIKQMEKYELLNIKKFKDENNKYDEKLGIALYIIIKLFSYLKYIRRVIILKLRNV